MGKPRPILQRVALTACRGAAVVITAWAGRTTADERISFNKQIRPLLSESCFKCHGADEKQRKGKLRLDVREAALEKKAIIPGKPDESELTKRIFTTNEEDVMPPPKEKHALGSADKELL